MKVRASVKPMCDYCKVIRRKGEFLLFAVGTRNISSARADRVVGILCRKESGGEKE